MGLSLPWLVLIRALVPLVFIFISSPKPCVALLTVAVCVHSRTQMTWSQLGSEGRGAGACASAWPSCSPVSSSGEPTSTSISHFR